MKKRSLIIFLCIAITIGLTGCSNESKGDTKEVKPTTAKITTQSTTMKNTDQELIFKRDLDKNGIEEGIKIIFKFGNEGSVTNEVVMKKAKTYEIIITSGDKQYTYEAKYEDNVIPEATFADFNTKDKYIEFYVNSEGPSGDPSSAIYRFDNNSIKKIYNTVGHIKEYDREGKIYTEFSKTCDKYAVTLNYYNINKGKVEFINKESLKGRKLQYDNSLILFTDSAYKNNHLVSGLYDSMGKEDINKIVSSYDKDIIVKVCEPNEVLTIIDTDNTYHSTFKEGNERNIRIKVTTSDSKEGWLEWLNGGD
jgi:hypothetical protein